MKGIKGPCTTSEPRGMAGSGGSGSQPGEGDGDGVDDENRY